MIKNSKKSPMTGLFIPVRERSEKIGGFSLLELLLVVGIAAFMMAVVVELFDNFAQRSQARRAGNHILTIQNSAEEYVAANFNALWDTLIPNLNDTAIVPIADLEDDGFLPVDYKTRNALRQESKILIRNLGNGFSGGRVIEVLSVTENTADGTDRSYANERIIDAAGAAGPKAGVIINATIGTNGCCAGRIQSMGGEWQVDLADFDSLLNHTVNSNRGYLAAYGRISFNDTFNLDYLYRTEIPAQPQINTMETNILMSGNEVQNVGVITADNVGIGYRFDPGSGSWVDEDGNLEILGQSAGAGSLTPFALSVDQALEVNGETKLNFRAIGDTSCEINAAGSVIAGGGINPATDCEIAGGDFVLAGDTTGATTDDLTINRLAVIARNPAATSDFRGVFIAREVNLRAFGGSEGPNFTFNGDPGGSKDIRANFEEVSVGADAFTDDFSAFDVELRGSNADFTRLQTGSANLEGSQVNSQNLIAGKITQPATTQLQNTNVEANIQSTRGVNASELRSTNQMFIRTCINSEC
jgi:type II secretory pathway pseudopilin PulG